MADPNDKPMVLKLAPLPRAQVGPFLILGVPKDAGKELIESSWAQRLIWARKESSAVPLEDVNWAREIITDPERRIRADATSLNVDTTDGVIQRLKERFQGQTKEIVGCQPIDVEASMADYQPQHQVPEIHEIRSQVALPPLPLDLPAVKRILQHESQVPVDPWDFAFEE